MDLSVGAVLTSNQPKRQIMQITNATLAATKTLRELYDQLLLTRDMTDEENDTLNWTNLPVFGGDAPRNTDCIWSWDADSLLVGSCADYLRTVSRAEYFAA